MSNINKGVLVVKNEKELEEAIKDKERVIALIYATWCPYCVGFLPVFMKYAQERDAFLLVEDDRWIVAEEYEVEVVPSALCYENGKVVNRLDGILGLGLIEKQLVDFITACGL